jgi:hypothetical protein
MELYPTPSDYTQYLQSTLNSSQAAGLPAAEFIPLSHAVSSGVWFNNIALSEIDPTLDPMPVRMNWCGSDNRTEYDQNLRDPIQHARLQQAGWIDNSIVYELNSEGWRSPDCREYDIPEPSLIVLGCSFTYGTGLHLHQTWGHKVSSQLGLTLVNLGMPGHALDLNTVWLMMNHQRIAQPRAVVICETPPTRVSWLLGDIALSNAYAHTLLRLASARGTTADYDSSTPSWLIDNIKLNSAVNYYKNRCLVEQWAKSLGIKFLHFNSAGVRAKTLARDLAHYGEDWHNTIAGKVLEQLAHQENN